MGPQETAWALGGRVNGRRGDGAATQRVHTEGWFATPRRSWPCHGDGASLMARGAGSFAHGTATVCRAAVCACLPVGEGVWHGAVVRLPLEDHLVLQL
eukprot:772006-Prymnesium_polylepis.1